MLEEYPWRFGAAELNSLTSRGGLVSYIGCIFHYCLSIKIYFLLQLVLLAQVLFQMDLKSFKGKNCVYFAGVGVMTKYISKVPSTW